MGKNSISVLLCWFITFRHVDCNEVSQDIEKRLYVNLLQFHEKLGNVASHMQLDLLVKHSVNMCIFWYGLNQIFELNALVSVENE